MSRRLGHRDLAAAVTRLREELRGSRREIRNLRRENEVPREAAEPLIHRALMQERFVFIHLRRTRVSVKLLCRVLVTDRSNYYAWVRAQHRRRHREYDDQRLTVLILEVYTAYPAYDRGPR